MKITHFLYNAFVIESSNKKIAIDPGGLFFYFFRFTTFSMALPTYTINISNLSIKNPNAMIAMGVRTMPSMFFHWQHDLNNF